MTDEDLSAENGADEQVRHGNAFAHLPALPDDFAHAAVIDYPWEFEVENGTGRFDFQRPTDEEDAGESLESIREDVLFEMEDDEAVITLLRELTRVLVDGAWVIFFADDRFQDVVRDAMRTVDGMVFRRNWGWTPERMGMGYYGRIDHYPLPVGTVGETTRYVTDRPTLFRIPDGRQTDYPTGKPVDLYRELLEPPVILDDERLLEPFCGSAPGAAVSAERGLSYWGCDIDVEAVEAARSHFTQGRLGSFSTDVRSQGDGVESDWELDHLHELPWSLLEGASVRVRRETEERDPLDPTEQTGPTQRTTETREGELVGRGEGEGLYYDSSRGDLVPNPIGPCIYVKTPADTILEVRTDRLGNDLLEVELESRV